MTGLEKYKDAFRTAFEIDDSVIEEMSDGESEQWDSIGHMQLIATLEDVFEIEFEPDEIRAINSFSNGETESDLAGILIYQSTERDANEGKARFLTSFNIYHFHSWSNFQTYKNRLTVRF